MQAHWRLRKASQFAMSDSSLHDFRHTLVTEVRDYPEWHRGRSRYGLWMIALHCPEQLAYIDRLRQQLGDLLHPTWRQPHLTLFVCGLEREQAEFDDDFTPQQLAQQLAAVRALASEPCALELGSPTSFSSAAYLPVSDPHGQLPRWRDALAGVCSEVRQATYVPHITLGLYRRQVSREVLRERLLQLPAPPQPQLSVKALEYVTYEQGAQFSRLECRQRILLTGA